MEEGGAVCGRGCGVKDDLVLSFLISKIKKISNCVSRSVMSDSEPMDCSPPGSSLHGIPQARILEWAAIPFSPGDLPDPGIEPGSPALQAHYLLSESPGKEVQETCKRY